MELRTMQRGAEFSFFPLILAGLLTALASGCDGNFDQRVRADIDELRADAFVGVNSNPAVGFGKIRGMVSTGGPVEGARVLLYPVDAAGQFSRAEADVLGDGLTFPGSGAFSVTLRRAYRGAVIVAVAPNNSAGLPATYADPALGLTAPRRALTDSNALLGYALDVPFASSAVAVTPLTSLVVERALFLGGISSGTLSVASKQVGAFFGLFEAREREPTDLLRKPLLASGRTPDDLVLAALSQLAALANQPPADLWLGLSLDARDDGELNGSIGFLPGGNFFLPDLGIPNFLGAQLLTSGYLAPGNAENVSGLTLDAVHGSPSRAATLAALDTARRFSDTTLAITKLTVETTAVGAKPGESFRPGVRAFAESEGRPYLVASMDGPSIAQVDLASDNNAVCSVSGPGTFTVAPAALPGERCVVTVRIRPDGTILTGSFDQTVTLTLTVR